MAHRSDMFSHKDCASNSAQAIGSGKIVDGRNVYTKVSVMINNSTNGTMSRLSITYPIKLRDRLLLSNKKNELFKFRIGDK